MVDGESAAVALDQQLSPVSVLPGWESDAHDRGGMKAWPSLITSLIEPESTEPPTRLQRLCHDARVEALRKTFEATKALEALERQRVEEACFLERLRLRLTAHFGQLVAPS